MRALSVLGDSRVQSPAQPALLKQPGCPSPEPQPPPSTPGAVGAQRTGHDAIQARGAEVALAAGVGGGRGGRPGTGLVTVGGVGVEEAGGTGGGRIPRSAVGRVGHLLRILRRQHVLCGCLGG